MALIQRGLYEQFAARHLGVKGPGALTSLEEGVMGTLPLDLSSDPMYWYLQGIRCFSTFKSQAAGAGSYSKIGIANTTTSNKLIRVLNWNPFVGTAPGTNLLFELHRCARTSITHTGTPGLKGVSTDTRISETQDSTADVIISQDSSLPGTLLWQMDPDNPAEVLGAAFPLILSPGEVFYTSPYNANLAHHTAIAWLEIDAYKAEL